MKTRAAANGLAALALLAAVAVALACPPAMAAADAAAPAKEAGASFIDGPENAAQPETAVPGMAATLARLVGAMLLVLALLVGGLMLLKRFAGRRLKLGGGDRPLRIVDKLSIGSKKQICLLNACGRYVVLGVTDKEINVLMEVTLAEEEKEAKDFAGTLSGMLSPLTVSERRSD